MYIIIGFLLCYLQIPWLHLNNFYWLSLLEKHSHSEILQWLDNMSLCNLVGVTHIANHHRATTVHCKSNIIYLSQNESPKIEYKCHINWSTTKMAGFLITVEQMEIIEMQKSELHSSTHAIYIIENVWKPRKDAVDI